MGQNDQLRFLIVSCNDTPWGGSEELWARAALRLAEEGAYVRIAKPVIDWNAGPIRALVEHGVKVVDLASFGFFPRRLAELLRLVLRPASVAMQILPLWWQIKRAKADLIVLSQGGAWDGIHMGWILRRLGRPYVLLSQKASDLYWPPDMLHDAVRDFIQKARHMFFVSHHNHHLLEEQIGMKVERASVVRNPFLVDYAAPQPWPEGEPDGPVRLACVGRFYAMEKGQDILLRVLARPKWRARNLTVDLYGAGVNRIGMERMAQHLGCDKVVFKEHVDDIGAIWASHHALILPSRAEGLPLVVVEAMLSGRFAIVSTAGGSGEVVEDGETGFLMRGFDEDGLDDAMERAWAARARWPEIGAAAARSIRQTVPADPVGVFAAQLVAHAQEVRGKAGQGT